jgi:hypothetical protein
MSNFYRVVIKQKMLLPINSFYIILLKSVKHDL